MRSNTAMPAGRPNYNGYAATRPAVLGLAKVAFLGLCQVAHVAAAPLKQLVGILEEEETPSPDDPSLWINLAIAAVLVLLGGAFAGLTIALMGQDGVYLQVIASSGEGKEQRHAKAVYKLLGRGKHWVLVTLLLSNVIVNETLPIVLDRSLGGGWPAVVGSTVLIVIFGEVIPQSVCVRYGLSIGAFMAPPVLALMWIMAPIAWPIAKLLDRLLGEDHGTVYKKSGLKTLVTLHKTLGPSPSDRLNQDEVTIISAVLDLKEKSVGDIMTPMEDVFTMSADTVLDEKTMDTILTAGYSRIPIYEPGNENNFVGMLLVKILITYDPEDCKRVSEFALATLPETRPETSCLDIVNFFQEGKSHMVLVSEFPGEDYGATGVVTLEDVIEELIGEEIIDESDVYIDVHKAIRRMAPAPKARVPKGQIVGNPDNAPLPAQDNLIDISDNGPDGLDALDIAKPKANGDSRTSTPATFGTSPKTTFVRRTSSGADGRIRGNLNDMREHLKHLGPSNLASRPKQTRYNTVKIKPGHVPLRTNSEVQPSPIIEEPYRDNPPYLDGPATPAPQGGEGEGLIKPNREAKDGVQALHQGYGSFTRSPPAQRDIITEDAPNSKVGVSSHSAKEGNDDGSSDTLSSLPSKGSSSSNLPHKRGAARSGSITENVIDARGVRKVVLETSTTSSDETEGRAPDDSNSQNDSNAKSPKMAPSPFGVDGAASDADETPKESAPSKKKRKSKKKKGGKSGSTGGGH